MLSLALPALMPLFLLLPAVTLAQPKIYDISPDYPDSNSTFVPDGAMEAYCQMLLQSPVPIPPDQIPWYCICSHCKGTQGPKGDRGDRGIPGLPGSPGPRGMPGLRGPPGFTGRPGIKGQKGEGGEKGVAGMQGPIGTKGDRGFKGEKGESGLEGPSGDPGPKGDDGVCPDACDASQGPPGPVGPPGPAGLRGLTGAQGSKGQKGDKGDSGASGAPGTNGVPGTKGDIGPKGNCTCVDGRNGAPGLKGDKGDTGATGDQGVLGATGPQGNKGDMGMMGMTGAPGPCMPMIKSAFSAGLTSSFPSPGYPVVFSKIFYNIQNSYIPTMGIYVAPINGTYVFSIHFTVYERVLTVGIFRNFIPVLKTTGTGSLSTTSQTVVLHLAEGDGVWVQVKDSNSNGMYTGPEASSIFSGYLLYPDYCEGIPLDLGGMMGREFSTGGATPTPTPSYNHQGDFNWDNKP